MKKLRLFLLLCVITSYALWTNDPLNDTVNFIIGGTIPGTDYALGFWPSIALIGLLLYGLKRYFSNLKFQMLEHKSKQIITENAQTEFKETYGSNDTAHRNAILGRAEFDSFL